ncbi:MAG: glycosyltransferase family 2 protein [Candidatus Omnitrophota bacterium]
MDISIIIINWNSFKYIVKCLQSIYNAKSKVNYEIIVLDNNSSERDIEDLNKYFKDVRLILNNMNEGFAKGNNKASKYAKGKVLIFLNPDTLLKDNVLDGIFGIISDDNRIGIAGPKIINTDGTIQKEAARYLPTLFSMLCNILLLKRIFNNVNIFTEYIKNYELPQEVEFISGACMAIRKSLFHELGGFSEDYFMYSEDDDICNRVIKAGMKNYYLASSSIIHIGSACSDKTYDAKLFECWFFKSRRTFFRKNGYFKYLSINVIYIIGGAFRIIIAYTSVMCELVIKGRKERVDYYKTIINKYKRIIMLGFGIDIIGKDCL